MSESKIVIIDYGLGNLQSVERAFSHCANNARISNDPQEILAADGVVLPGVGAFANGMVGLERAALIPAIKEYIGNGRPFLGICLGMQMLFESAAEFGHHQGLAVIPGHVEIIPNTTAAGAPHKIPHIGWNSLVKPEELPALSWKGTILDPVTEGESAYFVHSYTAYPRDPSTRLADAWYNGRRIAACVRKENVYGCQFHPEKSGPVGLRIILAFTQLCFSHENKR